MSTTQTTTAPAFAAGATRRPSLVRRIGVGILAAGAIVALAVALWPASAADEARADGEQLGEAVGQLSNADSSAEVNDALAEIQTAAATSADHAGDGVADQVAQQEDALARAADGFVGSRTTDDAFEADLYQAELETAIDDLTTHASDFRAEGSDVQQAYWEGFEEGMPND